MFQLLIPLKNRPIICKKLDHYSQKTETTNESQSLRTYCNFVLKFNMKKEVKIIQIKLLKNWKPNVINYIIENYGHLTDKFRVKREKQVGGS